MKSMDIAVEYNALRAAFWELYAQYTRRKEELRRILQAASEARVQALMVLLKANYLTRYLTTGQRQVSGYTYRLYDIKARIDSGKALGIQGLSAESSGSLSYLDDPDGEAKKLPAALDDVPKTAGELKRRELLTLSLIDGIKGKLLQLDILELRCRELTLSLDTALRGFQYESACIRKNLHPYGVFSHLYRRFRLLRGSSYFTLRDMNDVRLLGTVTGHILTITDSDIL